MGGIIWEKYQFYDFRIEHSSLTPHPYVNVDFPSGFDDTTGKGRIPFTGKGWRNDDTPIDEVLVYSVQQPFSP